MENCAECGGIFPLGDLTRRATGPRRTEYVCRARCARAIDAGRGLQTVSRARVHFECSRCGEVLKLSDEGEDRHVCAVDCLTADEGEG
jgi:hypothetical protein